MLKTRLIYEPKGRANEYNPLALNLYQGCKHGCIYCYAPEATFKTRENFKEARPRKNILPELTLEAARLSLPWNKPNCSILLCFTCDPYQPGEAYYKITRQAIEILKFNKLNVNILTKGGQLAQRDFDLLGEDDWFGVTLTCDNPADSVKWEPLAALPGQRIENLKAAKAKGLKTWVSLEPVLYPEQTLNLIDITHQFVDEFKVGVLNYHSRAKEIDWGDFGRRVVAKLDSLACHYYLKADLRKWL